MAKRKDTEHTKIRTQLEKSFNDISKNMEYGSHIGCNEGVGKLDKKKKGGGRQRKRRRPSYNCVDIEVMIAQ